MDLRSDEQFLFNQAGLAEIDLQELRFKKELRKEKHWRVGGGMALLAAVASAGTLMHTSRMERNSLMIRIDTDLIALMTGGLGLGMAVSQSDEKIKSAGRIADEAHPIAVSMGINVPAWVYQGQNRRDELIRRQKKNMSL